LKKNATSFFYKQAFAGLFILLFTVSCKTNTKVPQKSSSVIPLKEETRVAFEAALNDGMKFYIIEDYAEAIKSLERAVALNQNSGAAYYTLGKLFLFQKNIVKARAYSELAVAQDASNKYYYEQLGHIYEYQKLYADASKVYKRLTILFPDTPDYYYDIAAMSFFQNQQEEEINLVAR
jgi:tetratricopeptide (TPR) repeat protein